MKEFFTTGFYENPSLMPDVLNELIAQEQVADKDVYQSGELLFVDVYENDQTKKILSKIISDLDKYKAYNNESFATGEDTQIGLIAAVDEHRHCFGFAKGIVWDKNSERFVFAENLSND